MSKGCINGLWEVETRKAGIIKGQHSPPPKKNPLLGYWCKWEIKYDEILDSIIFINMQLVALTL